MITVPFQRYHILPLLQQSINADIKEGYEQNLASLLEKGGMGASILRDDGSAMVCGGVIKMWEGRGCVWTVFNEEAKSCFVPVFRSMRRFLQSQMANFNRLELAVPIGFTIGHRRAKLLGFTEECHLARKFLPNGEDCVLYAMIRGD